MAVSLSGSGAAVTDSITPTDPGLSPAERQRLSPQCSSILEMLRVCPRWNYELSDVGLSYTRRLSDLRAHGHEINVIASGDTGGRMYGIQVWKRMSDGSIALATLCADEFQESVALSATETCLIDIEEARRDGWLWSIHGRQP